MSEIGKSILKGAKEAVAYAKGSTKNSVSHKVKIPNKINVIDIRDRLNMDRKTFSDTFGFSLRTLEKWERGERSPVGPTRAYLIVIANNPNAVRSALTQEL